MKLFFSFTHTSLIPHTHYTTHPASGIQRLNSFLKRINHEPFDNYNKNLLSYLVDISKFSAPTIAFLTF